MTSLIKYTHNANFIKKFSKDPLNELREKAAQNNIDLPIELEIDGRIKRFATNHKLDDKAGWYIFNYEHERLYGAFGDWRAGITLTFVSGLNGQGNEQLDHYRQQADRFRRQAEAAQQLDYERVAVQVQAAWHAASSLIETHDYLTRKQIKPIGIRLNGGVLFIPAYDSNGMLWSIQKIFPNGDKSFWPGAKKKGHYASLGTLKRRLYITEGYATGATIHQVTGEAVAVAFDSGNLQAVCQALRAKYPVLEMILCGDDDAHLDTNVGRLKAEQAADLIAAKTIFPHFESPRPAHVSDFNDMYCLYGLETVRECLERALSYIPSLDVLKADLNELNTAQITPRCIVESILFADLAIWSAAGGTGKTTLFLRISIDLVLGRPVFGYATLAPGKVIYISAEDRREQCLARLRKLMDAAGLTPIERAHVLEHLLIWDVSGEQFKLIKIADQNVVLSSLSDDLVKAYQGENIALIAFDPLASFGASESKVNDNELALVTAARRICRKLDCAVLYIHHTGKTQAREKLEDQYAGRGGSALPDGARMVVSMNPWQRGDKLNPPASCSISGHDSLTYLTFSKNSYAKRPPRIWIKRCEDWLFEQFNELVQSDDALTQAHIDQLERWLASQFTQGMRYTQRQIQDAKLYTDFGMTLHEFRKALSLLLASGRVIYKELPAELKSRGRHEYLCLGADEFSVSAP